MHFNHLLAEITFTILAAIVIGTLFGITIYEPLHHLALAITTGN